MFRILLAIITILSCLALAVSYIAPQVSPADFWPIAFVGYFFPVLLAVNFLLALAWAFAKSRYFFLPATALLAGLPYAARFIAFNPAKESTEKSFKVMTWNVKSFDLYNWSHNARSRDQMMDVIRKEKPDILCLQEFYTRDTGRFGNVDRVMKELEAMDYQFEKLVSRKRVNHWGIATFTRHRIVKKGRIKFPSPPTYLNGAVYADVEIDGRKVRIINAHLQSNHFTKAEFRYLEDITHDFKPDVASSKRIASRMKDSFIRRAAQADALERFIARSPHPVIFCGDINDTQVSYTYQHVTGGLNDSFITAGNGIGRTYNGPLPLLRIDHVLFNGPLEAATYQTLEERHSDHLPVVATFFFKE